MTIVRFPGPARKPGVVHGFPPTITLDAFTTGYVRTALAGSRDADGALDTRFGIIDVAAATLRQMAADCKKFQIAHDVLLIAAVETGYARHDAGRDFWLTRNGCSDGYGARIGLPETVRAGLAHGASAWKPFKLIVGADGRLTGSC